eukprot:1147771-Pelagomonas_calceolata.AAC.2
MVGVNSQELPVFQVFKHHQRHGGNVMAGGCAYIRRGVHEGVGMPLSLPFPKQIIGGSGLKEPPLFHVKSITKFNHGLIKRHGAMAGGVTSKQASVLVWRT